MKFLGTKNVQFERSRSVSDRRFPGNWASDSSGACLAGAKVACAARNAEKIASVVAEINAAGGEALAVQMDVAEADQIKVGFKQVNEKFARLDILVNNAAITRDMLALRMKLEDWDAVIRTNLTGAYLCIQQAMGVMLRQRYGRIINVSSVVAETGNAGQANYVAAKAGEARLG